MQPTAPDRHDALRMVNVHQAKTQLSRLIDAAHAGETIVLAKAGKSWARLQPLEADDLAAWQEGALLSSPAHQ